MAEHRITLPPAVDALVAAERRRLHTTLSLAIASLILRPPDPQPSLFESSAPAIMVREALALAQESAQRPPAPPVLPPATEPRGPSVREQELAWRVQEVWTAHADKRRRFYLEVEGVAARPRPAPPPDIAKEIRAAILAYDADLLKPEDREEWTRESWARGSGLGIFLDPFCTGEHPDNNVREGGKRYLEPWRPWHQQRGKGCPVAKYGDLYFQRRAGSDEEPAAVAAPVLRMMKSGAA